MGFRWLRLYGKGPLNIKSVEFYPIQNMLDYSWVEANVYGYKYLLIQVFID